MNIPLLKEIQKAILAKPKNFVMSSFFDKMLDYLGDADWNDKAENCGTAACIAGWTVTLGHKDRTLGLPSEGRKLPFVCGSKAYELLDLTYGQDELLFYTDNWPERFEEAYHNATSHEQRAQVAVDRIQYFIDTNGTDDIDPTKD